MTMRCDDIKLIYLSDDPPVSGFRPSEMASVQDSDISSSIVAESE